MAAIALTAAQVGLVDPLNASVKSYIAGATITKGQVVALATDGTIDPADASSGGGYLFEQVVGVALVGGGAGQAIDVVRKGEVYGFTVSGMDSGDLVYVSNTAGSLDTAAGDVTVIVGRIAPLADKSATEVISLDINLAVAKAS
jgi:predicted RecA/RadA family phage recombinase